MAKPKALSQLGPSRGALGWLFVVIYAASAILAINLIRVAAITSGLSDDMARVTETRRFIERDIPLRSSYTGIEAVDLGIGTLVSAFMAGPAGWDKGFRLQMFYFLISFFSVISIWSVESVRKGHAGALISFTSIYALFYQTVGGAIIIPLYYLAYIYDTRKSEYWSTYQRQIPLPYAKALLPSLVLGYLVPTLAMFIWPLFDSDSEYRVTQFLIFLWQPTPLIVNSLLFVLSRLNSSDDMRLRSGSGPSRKDIPYIQTLYKFIYVVSTLSHIGTMSVALTSIDPLHSFTHVFLAPQDWGQSGMTKGLHAIFQADFNIIFFTSIIWAYQAVWDLKRVRNTDVSLIKAGFYIVAHTLLFGPAASLAAVWYWREEKLIGNEVKKE